MYEHTFNTYIDLQYVNTIQIWSDWSETYGYSRNLKAAANMSRHFS